MAPGIRLALLLLCLLYVSAEAGVNITAAQDNVSHLTPTPDTPTASATLTPPTPNATTTPPAWRTPPASPAPTPAKPLARHRLPAKSKPQHGRRHELLRATYKHAVVQQNKGPEPTPMTGAALRHPAHKAAAGPNRTADPQPSNTTGATGNTIPDATTPDISHAANKTLNDTSAVAASMAGNNTAAAGTGTSTDLRYMYDGGSAGATARSEEERKDEEVYQACTNTWDAVMRFLPGGGRSGGRKLLSVDGCRVVTISIGTVRRMLPGGGRSGGRKLLSLSSDAYQLLSDYVYELALRLNPYYSGGRSGGRRLLVVGDIPALVRSPASIPNSTRPADTSTATTAAGVATPRLLPTGRCGGHRFELEGKNGPAGNAIPHPAAPRAANNTHNETSAAPAADVAAGPGPANHTAVPKPETAAAGTNNTGLLNTYHPSRAGASADNHPDLSGAQQYLAQLLSAVEGSWEAVGRFLPGGGRSGGKHKRRLLSSRMLPGGGRRDTFSAPSGHRTAASHSSRKPAMPPAPLPPPARGAQPQAGGKL